MAISFHRTVKYLSLIAIGVCFLSGTGKANAACSSPTGSAGEREYFTADHDYKYCDGTFWISLSTGDVLSYLVSNETLNPSDKSSYITLSNGNLSAESSDSFRSVRALTGLPTGKYYWEINLDGNSFPGGGGFTTSSGNLEDELANDSIGWYYEGHSGNVKPDGISCDAYNSDNNIGMIALDMDNGQAWFGANGVWCNSGNPETGTSPNLTGISGTYYAALNSVAGQNTVSIVFSEASFTYRLPDGFTVINQTNAFTGGTASASSDLSGSGLVADDVFDGDPYGNLSRLATNAEVPAWVKYDLGSGNAKALQRFTMFIYGDSNGYGLKTYQIQGSNDDSNWTTLCSGETASNSTSAGMEMIACPNVTAYRYYRLYETASWRSNNTLIIYEWYGSGA